MKIDLTPEGLIARVARWLIGCAIGVVLMFLSSSLAAALFKDIILMNPVAAALLKELLLTGPMERSLGLGLLVVWTIGYFSWPLMTLVDNAVGWSSKK